MHRRLSAGQSSGATPGFSAFPPGWVAGTSVRAGPASKDGLGRPPSGATCRPLTDEGGWSASADLVWRDASPLGCVWISMLDAEGLVRPRPPSVPCRPQLLTLPGVTGQPLPHKLCAHSGGRPLDQPKGVGAQFRQVSHDQDISQRVKPTEGCTLSLHHVRTCEIEESDHEFRIETISTYMRCPLMLASRCVWL